MRARWTVAPILVVLATLSHFDAASAGEPLFRRGDADGDGVVVPLIDGIYLLNWQFLDGPPPPCRDAADVNDSGGLNPLLEAIVLLSWGFLEGDAPPAPGPGTCGLDPVADPPDELECDVAPPCSGEFVKPEPDERYVLAISDASAGTDDVTLVSVTLEGPDEVLLGYQFVVCYDDSFVTTEDGNVVFGEDVASSMFTFHGVNHDDGEITIGAAMRWTADLNSEDGIELYDVYFNTLSEVGTTSIALCSNRSDTVSPLLLSETMLPIVPSLVDGTITIVDPANAAFLRGDANGNGAVGAIEDAVFLLRWGFLEATEPPCMDAADANDAGGVVAITDALFLLNWGFTDGIAPPAPGTKACGTDPTRDKNQCATPPDCGSP